MSEEAQPTVRRATALPRVTGESAPALIPGGSAGAAPAAAAASGPTAPEEEAAAPPAATPEATRPSPPPAPDTAAPITAPAAGTAAAATTTATAGAARTGTTSATPTAPATPATPAASPASAAASSGQAPPGSAAATVEGGEPPSRRPNKPLLAAAGIGGTLLIGVPFLFMGLPGDDRQESTTASRLSSDTLLRDDDAAPAGGYAPASPSTSPSASAKDKAKTKAKVKAAAVPRSEPSVTPTPTAKSPGSEPGKTGKPSPKETRAKAPRTPARAGGALPVSANFDTVTGVLVRNVLTGLCADVPNYGNGKPDGPVNQFTCDNSTGDNQRWDLVVVRPGGGPAGADLFNVRNSKDGYCLDLPNFGGQPASTPVSEWHCNGTTSDNQLWYLEKKSSGKFWIRNLSSANRCLDVNGYNAGKDARLTIYGCALNDDHLWSFV
ncbi:RICIN domain-containing protein [Streptomyces liangshanensis]|uniref:Ricin-type beta-trefoil lectin domain protein n=1 Tax=Streptomyces liangshanensis TaxID=2717324 RepID=A0A6G9GUW9_9ACTN|nr:RICIN domain-containing protein [Streptomyces liangshanensis]QIQ02062.1 ricin-type beta-trefoil lectin domain protein [Streptomyces liangshanensis]